MTRDEIIKMAREAGFGPAVAWKECTPPFERFAALVAAAEREALTARILRCRYPVCKTIKPSGHDWDIPRLDEVIEAIRAREEK
jgi:hypothetical protein